MAFLRFSRDKRGYEHVYLIQPAGRRGKSPSRILYWFRTPPNIRVGREPFDESVRRALEAEHRDVVFNWPRLLATPKPPPETERWRDRRRAERAAKRAAEGAADAGAPSLESPVEGAEALGLGDRDEAADTPQASEPVPRGETAEPSAATPEPGRPRRRRRRRRRREGAGTPAMPAAPTSNAPDRTQSGDGE